jgi:hypothetical protein
MFGFSHRDKKDLPEKITFKLNGESLTNGEFFIDPISPSGTQMIQISNDELKKTWQPNRLYILSLAIDSVETSKPVGPMASHPIIHERPSSQVSSTFFPKLVGDCFVAVIGRADASPLVPPTSTVGN